jgi:hypothetical protein
MITKLIINDYQMFDISKNHGYTEPFKLAVCIQMFNHVDMIDYMPSLNGLDTSLAKKRLFRNHTQKYWNNLPYQKIIIPDIVSEYLYRIFNKPKNIF